MRSRLQNLEEALDRVLSRSVLRRNTSNDRKISLIVEKWAT